MNSTLRDLSIGLMFLLLTTPHATGNPNAEYPRSPEVHEDGRVTFRVIAPCVRRRPRLADMAGVLRNDLAVVVYAMMTSSRQRANSSAVD